MKNNKKTDASDEPIDFAALFSQELNEIEQARPNRLGSAPPPPEATHSSDDPQQQAHDMQLMGLALSGGGIRSATFGLGVLEAMAERGLLKHFDYLSTVSGGGYIGSWLSAWIKHETPDNSGTNKDPAPEPVGINKVEQALSRSAGRSGSGAQDTEPRQIRYLRQYSNYLTPQNGFFSADTWTTISTYLRNSSITLLILVLAFAALLLLPRAIAFLYESALGLLMGQTWSGWAIPLMVGLIGILLFFAMRKIGKNLFAVDDDHSQAAQGQRSVGQDDSKQVQLGVVLPVAISALLATGVCYLFGVRHMALPAGLSGLSGWAVPLLFGAGGALVYLGLFTLIWSPMSDPKPARIDKSAGELKRTSMFAGLIGGWVLYGFTLWVNGVTQLPILLTWGPPALILVALVTVTVHVALTGRLLGAEVHEWLLRLGGWLSIYLCGWIALFSMALYSPILFYKIQVAWIQAGLGIGWVVSTVAGILAGRGEQTGPANRKSPLDLVAKLAPLVFILGLLGLIAIGLNELLGSPEAKQCLVELAAKKPGTMRTCDEWTEYWRSISDSGSTATLSLIVAAGLIGFFSSKIDINVFSLHYYYRNRLIRCYLGASRQKSGNGTSGPKTVDLATSDTRDPNPFTGFDGCDDPKLRDVWKQTGPYHIINTALNLVGGRNLAWQQRKACSFIFTPKAYGFDPDKAVEAPGSKGYRTIPTSESPAQEIHGEADNPSLGAALAISGAAFSPNMGYHSSPAVSFLMAVFNVRLGYWFSNPSYRHSSEPGDRRGFANLPYLIYELLGMTDENKEYAYLSDGGHFENLGIYELVRRRCRYIVVVDAGQDGTFGYEDLGNAIRKCQVDFGVDIKMDTYSITPKPDSRWSERHCAVGTIDYPEGRHGTLLYLKPSLSGREPTDILEYAGSHPAFPHETTADQWFDESQFESYRKLGYHVGSECFRTAFERVRQDNAELLSSRPSQRPFATGLREGDAEKLFSELRQYWLPSMPIPREVFTRQGQALSELMGRLSADDRLRFLDAEVYPEWQALLGTFDRDDREKKLDQMRLPVSEEQGRAGFYFCTAMIQLAENVYCDLSLEEYWDHPDNRGWINLFRHWAASDMLRKTWAITAPTFGARFQMFCQHRFGFPNQAHVALADTITLGSDSHRNAEWLKSARDNGLLNDVETGLIMTILEHNRSTLSGHNITVIPLQLDVPRLAGTCNGQAAATDHSPLLRFSFGFAMMVAGQVVYFRIQDHLRKAGLGRRALAALCESEKMHGKQIRVKDDSLPRLEIPADAYEVPTEKDWQRFEVLLHSVNLIVSKT